MSQPRYFIVRNGDDWLIKYDDEEYGPYKTQNEALMFAIDAAHKVTRPGDDPAQVCLMGENGHFRPEWTAGQDSYPPRL